jgi:hypothetical protein
LNFSSKAEFFKAAIAWPEGKQQSASMAVGPGQQPQSGFKNPAGEPDISADTAVG